MVLQRFLLSGITCAVIFLAFAFVGCAGPLAPTATPVIFEPTPAAQQIPLGGADGEIPTPIPPAPPDPQIGQEIFTANGCNGCHYVDRTDPLVGPGLLGIYDRAPSQRVGYTADEYIIESIRQPSVYLVEGFQNLMLAFNESQVSNADVRNLIAYLQTLQ